MFDFFIIFAIACRTNGLIFNSPQDVGVEGHGKQSTAMTFLAGGHEVASLAWVLDFRSAISPYEMHGTNCNRHISETERSRAKRSKNASRPHC